MNQLMITAYSLDYEVIYSIVGKKEQELSKRFLTNENVLKYMKVNYVYIPP